MPERKGHEHKGQKERAAGTRSDLGSVGVDSEDAAPAGVATQTDVRPTPADGREMSVFPRNKVARPPMFKKSSAMFGEIGAMFASGLEALRLGLKHGVPVGEFLDQCWFLARVTTLPLILISVPFGMVIALEVGSLLQQIGAQSQLGAAMVLAVVREQAPVATALLIAGAGGSAMCADLGSRRIRDEIAAMEVMGVQPLQRLVLPRLLASTLVAVLLDSIVTVAGLAGGLFFGTHSIHITASSFFATFNELSQLADLWMALFKAAVFGFIAAMVACYKGMTAKGGPKGVGDAVNQAVVITFMVSFFINFVLTVVYFNFVPQRGI